MNKTLILISQNRKIPLDFVEQGYIPFSKKLQADRDKAKNMIRIAIEDNMQNNLNTLTGDRMNKVKVFINHASEDVTLAKWLYDELNKTSWIEPWLDTEKLLAGQDWKYEIEKALRLSDSVLVCMSKTSIQKTGYVQAEIRKAEELQAYRPRGKVFMIPILLETCDVPLEMQDRQWVDVSKPGNVNEIIRALETLR